MAKKSISKASSRSCANNDKQKFNSLIRVLRPKVYITDSSNFKMLVQELTGNKAASTDSHLPCSTPEIKGQGPVSDYEIRGEEQESSMEASFDASIESLSSWNSAVALNDEINQWSWNQIYEDIAAFDSSVNQQMELPAVWGLESWLLDIDHEPFSFGNGNPQIEQEITSFAGHCESSNPLEQHLANPALDSFY